MPVCLLFASSQHIMLGEQYVGPEHEKLPELRLSCHACAGLDMVTSEGSATQQMLVQRTGHQEWLGCKQLYKD